MFLLTWSGWKLCLWDRQRHLPALCLSCFQPAVWCSAVVLTSQLANALLHHIPHSGSVPWQKHYPMQSWDSFLSSHWPACGKVSEAGKENTVLWAQTREEVDSWAEVLQQEWSKEGCLPYLKWSCWHTSPSSSRQVSWQSLTGACRSVKFPSLPSPGNQFVTAARGEGKQVWVGKENLLKSDLFSWLQSNMKKRLAQSYSMGRTKS